MRAPVRRRTWSRALVAIGGAALLALVAVAALLLGGAFARREATPRADGHARAVAADGQHHETAPATRALHQQPTNRARGAAFAVLASAVGVAAVGFGLLRLARRRRPRTLRVIGLPCGRAPPALRIA
jgi:hypothetical protein